MSVMFACGESRDNIHQVGFNRLTSQMLKATKHPTNPEKILEMNGDIVGMGMIQIQNFLYVYVTDWPNALQDDDDDADGHWSRYPLDKAVKIKTVNQKHWNSKNNK